MRSKPPECWASKYPLGSQQNRKPAVFKFRPEERATKSQSIFCLCGRRASLNAMRVCLQMRWRNVVLQSIMVGLWMLRHQRTASQPTISICHLPTVDGRIIQTLVVQKPPHPKSQCSFFLGWFAPSNGHKKSNPESRV